MHRLLACLVIATLGLVGLSAGDATARTDEAKLHVSPSTVVAGHTVRVFGRCDPDTTGYVHSEAFAYDPQTGFNAVGFNTDAKGAFSVRTVIPLDRAPGTYRVGARCGGGNLGILVNLKVRPASNRALTAVPGG